jgi:acyl carrier protein
MDTQDNRTEYRFPHIKPDAYFAITFSSGSTGSPKGVIRQHYLIHFMRDNRYDNGFSVSDRLAILSDIQLGAAFNNVIAMLMIGGTLVCPTSSFQDAEKLANWLRDQNISIARFSRGLLQAITQLENIKLLSSIRLITIGGEFIPYSEIAPIWQWLPPGARVSYRYSSSETGNIAKLWLTPDSQWSDARLPAGKPIRQHRNILILDENQSPLPIGEVGEIAIQSAWLSAGYYLQPELTQARYLPIKDSTERIFLTGDMGYLSADGYLYLQGRKDFRVKIRGYTIELEGVEAALEKLPEIARAAVRVQAIGSSQRLVAYLLPKEQRDLNFATLKKQALHHLPKYALPSLWIQIDHLPTLLSGKVKRQELPLPNEQRLNIPKDFIAPQTPIEAQVAQLWEEILQQKPIGINENFFDLGGDSILAMKMLMEMKDKLGIEIPSAYFSNPTIQNLLTTPSSKDTHKFKHLNTKFSIWQWTWRGIRKSQIKKSFKQFLGTFTIQIAFYWLGLPRTLQGLDWFLRATSIENWVYPKEKLIFTQFIKSLSQQPYQINIREKFRQFVLLKLSGGFARYISRPDCQIHGEAHLLTAYQSQKRIMLLSNHSAYGGLSKHGVIQVLGDVPVKTISNYDTLRKMRGKVEMNTSVERKIYAENQETVKSTTMWWGYQYFQQNSLIRIVVDGGMDLSGNWQVVIDEAEYQLPVGWAELALQFDAIILPTFCTLAENFHPEIHFLPPLTYLPKSANQEAQVLHLLKQFGEFQTYIYQYHPESILNAMMKIHTKKKLSQKYSEK